MHSESIQVKGNSIDTKVLMIDRLPALTHGMISKKSSNLFSLKSLPLVPNQLARSLASSPSPKYLREENCRKQDQKTQPPQPCRFKRSITLRDQLLRKSHIDLRRVTKANSIAPHHTSAKHQPYSLPPLSYHSLLTTLPAFANTIPCPGLHSEASLSTDALSSVAGGAGFDTPKAASIATASASMV